MEQEPEGNLQTQKQAAWDLNTQTPAVKSQSLKRRETKVRNLSPEGCRKEEIRAGDGMAPTAWHLNRGFPLCTLSFLRTVFIGRAFFTRLLQTPVLSTVLLLLLQVLD